MRNNSRGRWLAAALVVFGSGAARAQHITIDGTLSPAQTLTASKGVYTIGANLGKQVGGNLFQSFGIFGLNQGEIANFTGPTTGPAVTNVIGRVTGGSPSSINGTIQSSSIPGANLYLINPAGIVFAPGASINVSGSFYAASADYLKLADGSKFQATNPGGSTLSMAAPAAFGFLNAAPPAITVNGTTLGNKIAGQTLGLVGGPINIANSTLNANQGTIQLAAVASTGEVPVNPSNQSAVTVTQMAPISITQGSTLDAGNFFGGTGGSGSIFVNGGAVTVDNSTIEGISNGPAAGGPVNITASSLSLTNGASILSNAFGSGSAGPIVVNVSGALSLTGGASIQSLGFSSGNTGSISVTAGSAALIGGSASAGTNASDIVNNTFGAGAAGAVTVNVSGTLSLVNGSIVDNTFGGTVGNSVVAGNAGPVTVTAGNATITDGGGVSSVSFSPGQAGNVSLTVAGALTVDGTGGTQNSPSGVFSQSVQLAAKPGNPLIPATGNAGQVTVSAGDLSVINSGAISTTTFAQGNAGQVVVSATDLSVTNSGVIFSDTFTAAKAGQVNVTAGSLSMATSGTIATDTFGAGNAGQVSVTAATLSLISSANIASTAQSGAGNAGSVSVDVTGSLAIDGTGASAKFPTGIFALALPSTTGSAGQVNVDAGTLSLVNPFGNISTTTFGAGPAGQVSVAADTISVTGGASISSGSSTSAPGGLVSVTAADSLSLTTGGAISTSASGSGNAGSIIVATPDLTMQQGGAISTQAALSNGGNITLSVGNFLYVTDSSITTSVLGSNGNGGNITIDPQLFVLDDSSVIAEAVAGHGGNITIIANNFLPSDDSVVSASSQLGISGTIELIGPRVDLNGSLVVLPGDLRNPPQVSRTACEAHGRPRSSLVDAGYGGLPQDTETTIPGLYIANRDFVRELSSGAGRAPHLDLTLPPLRQTVRLTMGCG